MIFRTTSRLKLDKRPTIFEIVYLQKPRATESRFQKKSGITNTKMLAILESLGARFQLIFQNRKKTNPIINTSRKKFSLALVITSPSIIKPRHLK